MAYQFEHIKLEKGMYHEGGRSFTQVLEKLDPSEQYKGTALEGLDAFQRQLKRFDIKVKGAGSDVVDKFFATTQSSVLFPEYIALLQLDVFELISHLSQPPQSLMTAVLSPVLTDTIIQFMPPLVTVLILPLPSTATVPMPMAGVVPE